MAKSAAGSGKSIGSQEGPLWDKLQKILEFSNFEFNPSTEELSGDGLTDTIELETKTRLIGLIEALLTEMQEAIKLKDEANDKKISSNVQQQEEVEKEDSEKEDQEEMKTTEGDNNLVVTETKEIILDDPNDTKKTLVQIAADKIKIIKVEKSPAEIETLIPVQVEPNSTNTTDNNNNINKRSNEEIDEITVASRKKSKIKIEDDEEEPLVPVKTYEYMGRDNDVPSIYNSVPEPTFHMKELVNAMSKALELYDDENNKETAKGFAEYWKRKCAVSHYPSSDLKDELPGEIPMVDFSGQKPGNQISFTTFMGYIEGFFRNFNEDDLRWLGQKTIHSNQLFSALNPPIFGPDGNRIITSGVQPYDSNKDPQYIPPLGANYQDVWQFENEGKPIRLNKLQMANGMKVRKQFATPMGDSSYLQSSYDELDTRVSTGPLTSRLLSAIVPNDDNVTLDFFNDEDEKPIEDLDGMSYEQIEERLKRELNYLGVFMNIRQKLNQNSWDQDWGIYKEDDEVSKEIRMLQRQLKVTQMRNNARKETLIPKVKEQIAWQEYIMIVEDLDKQIEQHYRRRIGVLPKKSNKKKTSADEVKDDNTNIITNASFKGLLDKRRRWIEKIGPLFKTNYEMRRMPEEPIFKEALAELDKVNNDDNDDGDVEGEDDGDQQEEVNADQL